MPSVTSEAGQRQIRRTLSRKSLVGEGPITFDELMSHRSSLLYFKQFCVDDMSTEQLLFWLEVCDYQTVKSDDFRAFLARKLLRKYITPTSPNVLGLSSRHREEIVKEVSSGKGLAHAFDEAAAQVHFNLRYDVFPRFVQSEASGFKFTVEALRLIFTTFYICKICKTGILFTSKFSNFTVKCKYVNFTSRTLVELEADAHRHHATPAEDR